ncbi:hypothetical protein EV645_6033 [Kribbella rubisoli]|uniref:Uncharacterized protein n=1 Tax=Kribbella rubisoli TaxID=3075929 RepID=A0A4Q7WM81_9ACTN|nr:hypothetical protein [Kribbella rubisoli]RZU10878.1 hypothetical protein EV645_6033 [Kribbella rubisoli]
MSYQQFPPPQGTPYPGPPPKQLRPHDPLAVALGNASFLGLGYFLIRRRLFGILGLVGTAILVVLLCTQRKTGYEFALLGWGVLQIVHGWFLARSQRLQAASRTKRLVALGVTLVVLGGVAFGRYDAQRIDKQAVAERAAGDCGGVRAAQAKYNLGHRIGDAPRTVRVEGDVAACDRIDAAADVLQSATTLIDVPRMKAGFDQLSAVAADPNQQQTVGRAVDQFVGRFPLKDSCASLEVTEWLRTRKPVGNVLDRPNALVPKIEPNALLGCADAQAAKADWAGARSTYQLLVTRYPHAKQAVRARAGVQNANYQILQAKIRAELARVRGLVSSGGYCSTPAKYSPAPRVRGGVNRAVFSGASEYTSKLPSQWKGTTADNAALVVCAGEETQGSAVRTCRYTPFIGSSGTDTWVTFYKIQVPVRVYELRTGRLIRTGNVQISGSVCPATISYTTYNGIGFPDTEQDVKPTAATIRSAFQPLVVRP